MTDLDNSAYFCEKPGKICGRTLQCAAVSCIVWPHFIMCGHNFSGNLRYSGQDILLGYIIWSANYDPIISSGLQISSVIKLKPRFKIRPYVSIFGRIVAILGRIF